MADEETISRSDFLKLAGITSTAFFLLPLMPFGKVLGSDVPTHNRPIIIKRTNMVGPDGVAFLYPTNPKGFVWYMNHNEPFDSHFERGGGSTYRELVKNEDGSWTADDNKRVKFNLNVDPEYKDAIGGCDMSFKDSMARGYTYDKSDPDHVELTGFFNIHKPTEHDGIEIHSRFTRSTEIGCCTIITSLNC